MMKHIIGQAVYQFVVVNLLIFTADSWVPEDLAHDIMPGYPSEYKYYSSDGVHMRSGRAYMISSSGEDYKRFEDVIIINRYLISYFS